MSPEAAFEQLYAEYARVVLAWFAARVDAAGDGRLPFLLERTAKVGRTLAKTGR